VGLLPAYWVQLDVSNTYNGCKHRERCSQVVLEPVGDPDQPRASNRHHLVHVSWIPAGPMASNATMRVSGLSASHVPQSKPLRARSKAQSKGKEQGSGFSGTHRAWDTPLCVRHCQIAADAVADEVHLVKAHGLPPALDPGDEEVFGLADREVRPVPVGSRPGRQPAAKRVDGVHRSAVLGSHAGEHRRVDRDAGAIPVHQKDRHSVGGFELLLIDVPRLWRDTRLGEVVAGTDRGALGRVYVQGVCEGDRAVLAVRVALSIGTSKVAILQSAVAPTNPDRHDSIPISSIRCSALQKESESERERARARDGYVRGGRHHYHLQRHTLDHTALTSI
jgi:hypothetical protein